ncbi:MAG: hypothetical protein HQK65_19140 [Desulfamplus sp.]|nr:hypothetical protein [Desulfamplus sp.]
MIEKIKSIAIPGKVIPKPEAKAEFYVKGWGKRRGEDALIYMIPNHTKPTKPYEKGITTSEFKKAVEQLQKNGDLTRQWFETTLVSCAKEGGCNFTTMGGIFVLLGIAKYQEKGRYQKL